MIALFQEIYLVCYEELLSFNIRTVPRKSHILIQEHERNLLPTDLPRDINVHAFCQSHDQLITNFFAHTFHLLNPTPELLLQGSLATSNAGMGLLSLQHMAPAAYLASLRNMLSEFAVRNFGAADTNRILALWSSEQDKCEN